MTRKLCSSIAALILFASLASASWNPLTSGTTQNLNAVNFIDQNIGFAAGAAGTLLSTNNGGATAFSTTTHGAAAFNDIIFVSSTEGYLMGASGSFYKTTDEASFTALPLPAALAAADMRKGAFSGTNRAFAAFDGSSSYLLYSSDSGATFTTVTIPDFEIYGVALTSDATWEWGKTISTSTYVITRNGAVVYSNGSVAVRKVFFYDSLNGYAVGDSGLFLATNNGGKSSADWSDRTGATIAAVGSAKNLHSLYFITSGIGWAVGDNGTIIFTSNGGGSFYYYNDSGLDPAISLRDINIVTVVTGGNLVAFAYVVGDGGKVFKLKAPSITGIAPSSRMQGWVGSLEVTGTDFASGIALTLSNAGVDVFSTTAESTTALNALAIVGPAAATGSMDVTVTNPDLTSATSAGAFAITANSGVLSIDNIWTDGSNKYGSHPLPQTITPANPTISFEVDSTSLTASLDAGSLVVRALLFSNGAYKKVYSNISGQVVTQLSASKANVYFALPDTLDPGTATLELYAEDASHNVSREAMALLVAGGGGGPAGSSADGFFVAPGGAHYWDPSINPGVTINWRFRPGVYAPDGVKMYVFTGLGGDVACVKYYNQPIHSMAGNPATGSVNIPLSLNDLAPQYRRAGMIHVILMDVQSGKKLGTLNFISFPKD